MRLGKKIFKKRKKYINGVYTGIEENNDKNGIGPYIEPNCGCPECPPEPSPTPTPSILLISWEPIDPICEMENEVSWEPIDPICELRDIDYDPLPTPSKSYKIPDPPDQSPTPSPTSTLTPTPTPTPSFNPSLDCIEIFIINNNPGDVTVQYKNCINGKNTNLLLEGNKEYNVCCIGGNLITTPSGVIVTIIGHCEEF